MTVVQIVAFAATAWVRRSNPDRAVMTCNVTVTWRTPAPAQVQIAHTFQRGRASSIYRLRKPCSWSIFSPRMVPS